MIQISKKAVFMKIKKELHVSVRDLVEFVMRHGDLDLTLFGSENPVKAIRAHQAIQKSRPNFYKAEVSLLHRLETDTCILNIRGRIDGIFKYDTHVIIDEIKTTRKSIESIQKEKNSQHWGQAKCYAYIYSAKNKLRNISVQLTYHNIEENWTKEILHEFKIEELAVFFDSLVKGYLGWAEKIHNWKDTRDFSIGKARFPFSRYRPGQDMMIKEVDLVIKDGKNLIIQAPTGIGKTMAVIFPAIRALPDNSARRIFFLTARTTGRNTAEQCLDLLRTTGLKIKHLSLTAKDKICFNAENSCNGQECIYAHGFYDRINEAVQDAFNMDCFTRDAIISLSEKHRLCPFEFSLELALWVDIIICDYNYVFDPRVYLRRFFDNAEKNSIILIDEAHNLIDRSRDMYSATLYKRPVPALKKLLRIPLPHVYRSLNKLNSFFLKAKKEIPGDKSAITMQDYPEELCHLLKAFVNSAEKWLIKNESSSFRENLLELFFDARNFLNTAERYDACYLTYFQIADGDFFIKLFCIDPSRHLNSVISQCLTAVFFSATLTPPDYFKTLLGCGTNTRNISLPSPFTSKNLCVMIAGGISVLYKHRENTKYHVADMIRSVVQHRKGNYLVFFPSYEYMGMVNAVFERNKIENISIAVQSRDMSEQDRDLFLCQFRNQAEEHFIGFVVMGGFFAESIDLVGDRLTGAVIVGVGFPRISTERELIKKYFDSYDRSGLGFAYQIPGMIKVLQAAGRVIRSETDRGVVLLIDARYPYPPYRIMMPGDWNPKFINNSAGMHPLLKNFWNS